MSSIRVEIAQMAHASRVFFVADDGTETEVSSVVTNIELRGKVGDAVTARLDVVKVAGNASGELTDLLVTDIKLGSRWRKRLRDITAFGNRERRYVL